MAGATSKLVYLGTLNHISATGDLKAVVKGALEDVRRIGQDPNNVHLNVLHMPGSEKAATVFFTVRPSERKRPAATSLSPRLSKRATPKVTSAVPNIAEQSCMGKFSITREPSDSSFEKAAAAVLANLGCI